MSMRDDESIDRAAYAMTRGEPSPQLRQTVRARIDLTHSKRRVPAWVPAAAVVMASVVAVVVVGRALSGSPGGSESVHRTATGPRPTQLASPPTVTPTSAQPPAAVAVRVSAPRTIGRVRRTEHPTEVPQYGMEHQDVASIPPSDAAGEQIPALVIRPLELTDIAVDTSSAVMPIEIDPLQIVPLQPE
jgi:hypothetical protein